MVECTNVPRRLCILMIDLLMKIDNDTSVSQDWSLYEGPSRKCDSCLNHIIALRTADERLWGTGVHRNRVVNILSLNRRLKVRTVANIMVKTDKPIFLSYKSHNQMNSWWVVLRERCRWKQSAPKMLKNWWNRATSSMLRDMCAFNWEGVDFVWREEAPAVFSLNIHPILNI